MSSFDLKQHPHRRFNPLTREWVLVSPHRTQRPWLGQVEKLPPENLPEYDPACYMCPGNRRASGAVTPTYTGTYVFDNDYPALVPDESPAEHGHEANGEDHLLKAEPESGICRVVCFSPRHDLRPAKMDVASLRQIIDLWADQYRQLGALSFIRHVQIFENRGAMMGASNPHPHGQIWATSTVPDVPTREGASLAEYQSQHNSCLLCDYLALERQRGERIMAENDHFAALVPFWAVWPFETMILGRRHVAAIDRLSPDERDGLADILKRLTSRYDRLFEVSFPYTMGFHQQPTDGTLHTEWHLHAHFLPPLLRSATVRKFMVGFELLDMPQRDITSEAAAALLREVRED